MKKTLLIMVLPLACIQSCNWMGQGKLPIVKAPKKFPSINKEYQNLDNLPYLSWWRQFNDPSLNQLIKSGLQNNLDIGVALGRLEQSRGELRQAKLSWLPNLELLAGYSTNPALGIPGVFIGAWPMYAINIAQTYKKQERAKFNEQYTMAMIDGVRLTVIGQITASYFTLLAQREQLKLLKILKGDLDTLTSITRKEIKAGLRNDIDLAQTLVDDNVVAAQIKLVEQNITISQNSLRYLINKNPGDITSRKSFANINFNHIKPGSLPATVLQNRPDLKMAEYAVKSSYSGVAIAYTNLFPTMLLDDYIGEGSIPTNTFEQATDSYANWTIAPNTFGKIMAEKGAYKEQVYNYIKTVRQILKEVDNSFTINKKSTAFYIYSTKAEDVYKHKYHLQNGLLNTGLISYKELLISKTNLDYLALAKNQAKLQQALSLVTLYQDLAGGYKC